MPLGKPSQALFVKYSEQIHEQLVFVVVHICDRARCCVEHHVPLGVTWNLHMPIGLLLGSLHLLEGIADLGDMLGDVGERESLILCGGWWALQARPQGLFYE